MAATSHDSFSHRRGRTTPAVSWGAVLAGGIAAAAVTLVLLAFGVGVGFSVVSPWSDQGVSSTTLHVGAGIYLVVMAMLASTVRRISRRPAVGTDGPGCITTRCISATPRMGSWPGPLRPSDRRRARRGDHSHPGWRFGGFGAQPPRRPQTGRNPTDVYVERLLRVDADTPPAAAGAGLRSSPMRPGPAARTTDLRPSNCYGSRAELGRVIARGMTRASMCRPPTGLTPRRSVARRTGMSQA